MKLAGLRVVDLSVFLPGPYLTQIMADHGADVLKIEPPGGDPGRQIGLSDGPSTVFFRNVNRGKRSVVLDLKTQDGRDRLLAACDDADVFVESFRPGVAARLGAGYETLSRRNPGLVYCSISAFGQDGPYRDRPAHALASEAIAGALGITLGADDTPAIPGIAMADILAATQGLAGVLMALLARQRSGRGDHVDIAMSESVLAAYPNVMGPVLADGRQPVPKHERSMGGSAFYNIYRTSDARHLVLAGQEPKFVRALLDRLGRTDLEALCARGPGAHQKPVIDHLREVFATRSLADWLDWLDWFEGMDVCFAPVNTIREALDDPHMRSRGMVLVDDAGREFVGPAIRFRNEPARPSLVEPALDAHADAPAWTPRPDRG